MRLSRDFYITNRQRLMDRLPEGTTVLLFAGRSKAMCQDSDYRFLPDRNFFYMTGLSYEGGILGIRKVDGVVKTKLYALPSDPMKERWTGKRMSFEELSQISGVPVDRIYAIDDFEDDLINDFIEQKAKVAFDRKSIMKEWREVCERLQVALGEHNVSDISDELIRLRMVKQDEEIEAIREAGRITEEALNEMKKLIRPGVSELELYTALDYHMARRGALIPAFPTIVANGTNSFYLHHSEPEDMSGVLTYDGSFIQIDVGARAKGYCGDISRVYFVGGKKGDDDKRFVLYELIKKLRDEVFKTIRPGISFVDLNNKMRKITIEYLSQYGLFEEDAEVQDAGKYYWHNTGHHLGLDVHDCCFGKDQVFEEGNCLAIEPGVYIPEWNVGFRIEDDVLVTSDGCELLSSGIDTLEDIVIE